MDRPNILLICTDQQSAGAMSCAGNTDLHTPGLDALAARGVRFTQTYCTQPLCTPSRASMFSGMMPSRCGVTCNDQGLAPEARERGLGRVLQAEGYDCVYGGKWHVPEIAMPESNDHGFRTLCGFDDQRLADACVDYFGERRDRPFFMVAGFDNPHNICEWGRNQPLPWGDIGAPPPPEDCPGLPANFAPAPFEPEAIRVEQRAHWNLYPYQDRSPEAWRQLRWAYYRLVEKVDAQIGKVLAGLSDRGLAEDTVVIFTSDHGDGHGAHRWNQKSALFEEVVRVPLIVSAPGGRRGHGDAEHLVANGLDLFPTVCDYTGVAPPDGLQGRSLRQLVDGKSEAAWRDGLVIETFFDGGRGYETTGRALRWGPHKYVVYDRGAYREQLFDLAQDPGEQVNLAVESRHQGLLDACRGRLAEERY